MTAALLLEEALKLPEREREVMCDVLENSLHRQVADENALGAELQRRIRHAEEHPEDGQTLEEWREEIFATRGLRL